MLCVQYTIYIRWKEDRSPGNSVKLDFCDVSTALRQFFLLLTPEEVVQDQLEAAHPGHAGLGHHRGHRQGDEQ